MSLLTRTPRIRVSCEQSANDRTSESKTAGRGVRGVKRAQPGIAIYMNKRISVRMRACCHECCCFKVPRISTLRAGVLGTSRPRGGCWDQGDVSTHSRCVDETGRASGEAPNVPVVLRPVPRFRGSQALAATLMRTSESKGHWRLYDSSAVLNLKFLHELAAQR